MLLEVLVALSIMATGLASGYFLYDLKVRRSEEEELKERLKSLNENLANFGKAYEQFNSERLDLDTRITSLEFKLNGVVQHRGKL
jgi:type II secretory pathway component PulJ